VLDHRRLGRIVINEDSDTVPLNRFANQQRYKAVDEGAPEKTPPWPLDEGVVFTAKKP
jgi:hypothetical protein